MRSCSGPFCERESEESVMMGEVVDGTDGWMDGWDGDMPNNMSACHLQ